MQALLVIVLLVVLGFLGYQYLYDGAEPPPTVEAAAERARAAAGEAVDATRDALRAAGQAVAPAAEQAGQAIREGAAQIEAGARQLGQEARAYIANGVDVGAELRETASQTRAALDGITDAATAQAQLPTLRDLDARLEGVGERLEGLSAEARRGFAGLVATILPTVRDLAERVKAIEGVGPEVDAVLDSIVARLEGWSRAPA